VNRRWGAKVPAPPGGVLGYVRASKSWIAGFESLAACFDWPPYPEDIPKHFPE